MNHTIAASPAHIRLDERGVAWIDDTNIKVVEVVLERIAHGISPEEMFQEHYGDLSLSQIYAALSYYHDHQSKLDTEIKERAEVAEALRAKAGESAFVRRLQATGQWPLLSLK